MRAPHLAIQPSGTSNDAEWTHRLGGIVGLAQLLAERGVDAAAVLARAGLPANTLGSPDNRIPAASVPRLLSAAIEATACPHLALLVGERWRLHDGTGLMLQRARCSSTVGEALEAITLFQQLNSQASAAYLIKYESTATMGFVAFQPHLYELAASYEVAIGSMVSMIRELVRAADWAPRDVYLPRARPADGRAYREFFHCRVHFDSERACFSFPQDVLTRPMSNPDRARAEALEAEAFRRLDKHLLPQLFRTLRLLLLSGPVRGESVAQHLSLHRRTLDRRLRTLGTSFQAVLDEVRFDVARQLLSETRLPVSSIACTVGFAESSSFVRAFKQWAGTTPMKWRDDRDRASRVDIPQHAPAGAAPDSLTGA